MSVPTLREVFEKAKAHLLSQNQKSMGPSPKHTGKDPVEICVYRGPNGLMCGAGPFIPDDKYQVSFESCGITHLPVWNATGLPRTQGYTELLSRIQNIHDEFHPTSWANKFKELEADLPIYESKDNVPV